MKLLHLIETLGRGGAETLLVTLLPAFAKQGDLVAVGVLRAPLDLKPELEAKGVPVHLMTTHHKWNLLAGARDVAALSNATECDVIHAHLFFPSVYACLARLLNLTQARVCITFHNLAHAKGANRQSIGMSVRRALARFLFPKADALFAVSGAVAANYRQALGLKDIRVVHNPVDIELIDATLSADGNSADHTPAQGAENPTPRIVLPGRLAHEKGHDVALSAFEQLRSRGCKFSAVFAGGGPNEAQIRQQADWVHVTGKLPHKELIQELDKADVVIVPSRFEGFGLVAAESMAAGRAVIVSDAGGLREVVKDGEGGVVVPSGEANALAEAIQALVSDPKRRALLARKGRQLVEERFASTVIADQYRSNYLAMEQAIQ